MVEILMRPTFFLLPVCALTVCFPACTGPVPLPGPSGPSIVSENPADVKTPFLRSAYFEKQWGKPDLEVMSDGTYRLRYRQGTTLNFAIIESRREIEPAPENPPDWAEPHDDPEGTTPEPAPHRQSWKHTTIVGTPVKWYQADGGSGADFPGYRTVDFPLTAPDGRVGFYRISICSDSGSKAADWIHRVGWE